MKKGIIALLSGLILSFCSCEKEEIDYTIPATIFIKGDASYSEPLQEETSTFVLAGLEEYNNQYYYLQTNTSLVLITVEWPKMKVDVGMAMPEPDAVGLYHPFDYSLGYSKEIEKGTIRYMGLKDGFPVIQWEDVTFIVPRNDGSGITDEYYIRGTLVCKFVAP